MSEFKLIEEIIRLSHASVWDIAKFEWKLKEIYKEYEPFGPKKGEGIPRLPYEQTPSHQNNIEIREGWFCPYCGASISRTWKHCKSCGKLLEINL